MQRFLRTKTFRAAAIITVLIGLYAIAGFAVAPRLVRSALLKDIPESMGVTPAVGEIRINPFLFQVTVGDGGGVAQVERRLDQLQRARRSTRLAAGAANQHRDSAEQPGPGTADL